MNEDEEEEEEVNTDTERLTVGASDLYSLEEINDFLGDTFGKAVKIKDYFQGTNTFLKSTAILQKLVGFEALNKKEKLPAKKKKCNCTEEDCSCYEEENRRKNGLTLLSFITGCFSWSAICCCSFLFLLPWMGSGWLL